jgi:hypothetical protein
MDIQSIKTEVEKTSCEVHNEHPNITVNGDHLQVSGCCEPFGEKCIELIAKLAADSSADNISGLFDIFD